jgi:hypothetical protein
MTARANRLRVAFSRAIPSTTGSGGFRSNEEPAQEAVCLGRKRYGAASATPAGAVGARRLG